jgi:hypothetical protein
MSASRGSPSSQEYGSFQQYDSFQEYGSYTGTSMQDLAPHSVSRPPSILEPLAKLEFHDNEAPWTHMQTHRFSPYGDASGTVYDDSVPAPTKPAPYRQDPIDLQGDIYFSGMNTKPDNFRPDRRSRLSAASSMSGSPRGVNRKSRSPALVSKKTKEKNLEFRFENNLVDQKGGKPRMIRPEEPKGPRTGVRTKKLPPDVAAQALNVRRMTACWNCWIQKVPVSLGLDHTMRAK